MRIGKVVPPVFPNHHLRDHFVEVFPDGTVRDLAIIRRVPQEHRGSDMRTPHDKRSVPRPSPFLIRQSWFDRNPDLFA